jgi:glutamate 5-kinase
MTTYYPNGITPFTTHVDITEIIDASHVNKLQTEVTSIETIVGVTPSTVPTGGFATDLTAASSTSNPTPTSNLYLTAGTQFNSVSDRITNVENIAITAYTSGAAAAQVGNVLAVEVLGGF